MVKRVVGSAARWRLSWEGEALLQRWVEGGEEKVEEEEEEEERTGGGRRWSPGHPTFLRSHEILPRGGVEAALGLHPLGWAILALSVCPQTMQRHVSIAIAVIPSGGSRRYR
jgi:hypothetical protein